MYRLCQYEPLWATITSAFLLVLHVQAMGGPGLYSVLHTGPRSLQRFIIATFVRQGDRLLLRDDLEHHKVCHANMYLN